MHVKRYNKPIFENCLVIEKKIILLHLNFGSVVQLVRMPPCHGGGRGFESRPVRKIPRVPVGIFYLKDFGNL